MQSSLHQGPGTQSAVLGRLGCCACLAQHWQSQLKRCVRFCVPVCLCLHALIYQQVPVAVILAPALAVSGGFGAALCKSCKAGVTYCTAVAFLLCFHVSGHACQVLVAVILVPALAVSGGLVLLSVALMRYLRYLKRSHDAIHLTEAWKRRNPPGLISDGNDRVLREVSLSVDCRNPFM